MKNWFTEHPRSIGETYTAHMKFATGVGWRLLRAGICCFTHGFFPFVFVSTASNTVKDVYWEMQQGKRIKKNSERIDNHHLGIGGESGK